LAALDTFPLHPLPARAVVVAPHPDDEVLDVGGLLALLSATGLLDENSWCLATWARDGHPDHEAAGRSAASATGHTGAQRLSFPVWAWHWAQPADPRVPWPPARRIPLPPAVAQAKRYAVDAFGSQLRPLSTHPGDQAILGPTALARRTREYEVILL
jgi:LmbE family N-acetylglucosaminyl deacetylase